MWTTDIEIYIFYYKVQKAKCTCIIFDQGGQKIQIECQNVRNSETTQRCCELNAAQLLDLSTQYNMTEYILMAILNCGYTLTLLVGTEQNALCMA